MKRVTASCKAPMEHAGRVRVRRRGPGAVSVELSGELDVAAAGGLREILAWASDSGYSVAVDLSGVTFLDSSCLRELVVHQSLRPARVALCDPSPQVELSVAACGVEAWIHFRSAVPSRYGSPAAARVSWRDRGEERGCW